MTNTDTQDTCIECGEEIGEEDDAVFAPDGVDREKVQQMADGEEVSARELFGFDDGPYCSLDCSLDTAEKA